jgi:transketolase C-terminal domain/subunit
MSSTIDNTTRALIEATVRAHAGPFKVRAVAVRYDVDQYDFEWLDIDIVYDGAAVAFPARHSMTVRNAMYEALEAAGDLRKPYISYYFADDFVPAGVLARAS